MLLAGAEFCAGNISENQLILLKFSVKIERLVPLVHKSMSSVLKTKWRRNCWNVEIDWPRKTAGLHQASPNNFLAFTPEL